MLIEELTNKPLRVLLKLDNQNAITLIKDGAVNKRSKHIDIKYQFAQESVVTNNVNV